MTKQERINNIRTLLNNVELDMLNPGYINENGELLGEDLQEKWIKKSLRDEYNENHQFEGKNYG